MTDCATLQTQYDELYASYLKLLKGERVQATTYGDQSNTKAMVSPSAVKAALDELAQQLSTQCGISVRAEGPRMFAPRVTDGRRCF